MVPASGSEIKKTHLYTARMRESDAADPSEAFPLLRKCERSLRNTDKTDVNVLNEKYTTDSLDRGRAAKSDC